MRPAPETACHAICVGVLRAAALLVPAGQRGEWWREWQAELWHVCQTCEDGEFSWPAQREIAAFCMGAFPDALCVRRQMHQAAEPAADVHGSAAQCLVGLLAAALLAMLAASLLPGLRAENDAARYQVRNGIMLVWDGYRGTSASRPTISQELYKDWKTTRQRYFDGLAYYRMEHESASLPFAPRSWAVAHATANFFTVLGVPVQRAAPPREAERGLPQVIVSHAAWVRDFHADPGVAGRIMRLGPRWVRIAGVTPPGAWRLPGEPEAWLLEDDAQLAAEGESDRLGYLIAHLSRAGLREGWDGEHVSITTRGPDSDKLDLYGAAIAVPIVGPWTLCRFALFLALLALPAVTSVSLGDSNVSFHRPSLKRRALRVLFLGAKLALFAAIGCYGSMLAAYCRASDYSPSAGCVQVIVCFLICLLGFRWALIDQRQRCPVCLRRVTHPAQVGLASRTFLGWNGTEMMCMGGHTLLHVPSLPTSWFSSQRWMYLDASWEFLFADSGTW